MTQVWGLEFRVSGVGLRGRPLRSYREYMIWSSLWGHLFLILEVLHDALYAAEP